MDWDKKEAFLRLFHIKKERGILSSVDTDFEKLFTLENHNLF